MTKRKAGFLRAAGGDAQSEEVPVATASTGISASVAKLAASSGCLAAPHTCAKLTHSQQAKAARLKSERRHPLEVATCTAGAGLPRAERPSPHLKSLPEESNKQPLQHDEQVHQQIRCEEKANLNHRLPSSPQRQQRQHGQEAAITHALTLSGSSGNKGLIHPLYAPLSNIYGASTKTADVMAGYGSTVKSANTRSNFSSMDEQLLENLLNLCPMQTSAATLVETKLANRAVRLDTLPQSLPVAAATVSNSAIYYKEAAAGEGSRQRQQLKLSRRKAKQLGLLDVRRDFVDSNKSSGSSRSACDEASAAAAACRLWPGKLRYEDVEQLHSIWLQYVGVVCGEAEAAAPRPPHQQKDHQQRRKAADRCSTLSKGALQGAKIYVTRSRSPSQVGIEGIVVEETQQSLLLLCPDQRLRRLLKNGITLKVETNDNSTFFLHPQHMQQTGPARSKAKLKPRNTLLLI